MRLPSRAQFATLASPVFAPESPGEGHANRRHTPFLERLAERGVVFRHVYCQVPICNPSRTSFLTGRRPSRTHVYTNDDAFPEDLPTLVDALRAADPGARNLTVSIATYDPSGSGFLKIDKIQCILATFVEVRCVTFPGPGARVVAADSNRRRV